MKHTFLVVFIALPILQYALSAPAFAQAKVVVGGVEMESEVGVPGVLGDVDDDLEEVGEDDEDSLAAVPQGTLPVVLQKTALKPFRISTQSTSEASI